MKKNWDRIKASEQGDRHDTSALAGVPAGMTSIHRAAKIQNRASKVGFDWSAAVEVFPKVSEELGELAQALEGSGDTEAELGDLLFSVVNLARHLGMDPELALRGATSRFEERFRRMEEDGPLVGLGIDELNERWDKAKER